MDRAPSHRMLEARLEQIIASDLGRAARANTNYRKVYSTNELQQVVLMSIPAAESNSPGSEGLVTSANEIGLEQHSNVSQFIYVVAGEAQISLGKSKRKLRQTNLSGGGFVLVNPKYWHNVANTGQCPLKLYTIYSPPLHPPNLVEATK